MMRHETEEKVAEKATASPEAQYAALEARLQHLARGHGMDGLALTRFESEESVKFLLLAMSVAIVVGCRPSLTGPDPVQAATDLIYRHKDDTSQAQTILRAHGWLVRLVWIGCRKRGEI